MAVRLGIKRIAGGECSSGADSIVDHDGLPERATQGFGDGAAEYIDRAAGCAGRDDAQWPACKILGVRRRGKQHSDQRCDSHCVDNHGSGDFTATRCAC